MMSTIPVVLMFDYMFDFMFCFIFDFVLLVSFYLFRCPSGPANGTRRLVTLVKLTSNVRVVYDAGVSGIIFSFDFFIF